MSYQEGASVDIPELLRRLGEEALIREAEQAGLSPKARRLRCPFAGCEHHKGERQRDAQIYSGQHPRIFCFACETKGDLVDLLERTRGWNKAEVIAHLSGQPIPSRPPPQLRVVSGIEEDPDKLKPADVRRLWDAMAKQDAAAQGYLEKRGLGDATGFEFVRFATEAHQDHRVKSHARRGYRTAALLTDVVGNPRGIQMRLVREPLGDEPKVISVKGSNPSRAFFGRPDLIEAEPLVCVGEGMADTLALASWTAGRAGVAVAGASGKSNLSKLAAELEAAGIPIDGKIFVLFPQNDRPKNQSRREFVRLGQLLLQRGAHVVHVNTNEEYKDVAQWLQANPDEEWPPPEVRRVYERQPGEDGPEGDLPVRVEGCAVAIPATIRTQHYAQDFTTLCTLLDDPVHREPVLGRGELTWCEMTWRVRFAGREISETDLSTIRLGLEAQGRSTSSGKPLKFSEEEIARAMTVISRRQTTHPVRDWLQGLRWDGHHRLMTELPVVVGQESNSFAATLLTKWMISACARALRPGAKVDTVLVLVGGQGVGKSTFFSALGGDWFTDSPVQVADKDGKLVMRRAWIVEWAELEAMRRARDQEAIKAFLSAKVDLFRKPYGRDVIEAPRHCVIVGTTNNREFLHDPTGSRRFWPVEVLRRVDVAWLQQVREQLWAEAVQLAQGGAQWWLTDQEDAQLAEVNQGHESRHPWTELIEDWLHAKGAFFEVTATQVLVECLAKPVREIAAGDEQTVGRVMRELGWERKRKRQGESLRWVYARPSEW